MIVGPAACVCPCQRAPSGVATSATRSPSAAPRRRVRVIMALLLQHLPKHSGNTDGSDTALTSPACPYLIYVVAPPLAMSGFPSPPAALPRTGRGEACAVLPLAP